MSERVNFSPLNLVRCIGDFALISLQIKIATLDTVIDDAMDVWGDTDE